MSVISRNLSSRFPSHSPSQHETRSDKIFFYPNLNVSLLLGKEEEKLFERDAEKASHLYASESRFLRHFFRHDFTR